MGLEQVTFVPDLPLDRIQLSEYNIRKRQPRRGLESLKESMESKGLMQPVTVVGPKDDDTYELIMGQRRFLAATELGWQTIPAIIMRGPIDNITKVEMSLSENIHVQDPFEQDILAAFKILYDEKYHSVTEIQQAIGISRSATHDYIWLLEAPKEIIALIRPRVLPRTKAADIVKACYPDKTRMIELADVYLSGRLTREEKKRLIELALKMRDAPISLLEEEAKKPPLEIKITLLIPFEHYNRLGDAAEYRGFDREKKSELAEMARIAVLEWLEWKGL